MLAKSKAFGRVPPIALHQVCQSFIPKASKGVFVHKAMARALFLCAKNLTERVADSTHPSDTRLTKPDF